MVGEASGAVEALARVPAAAPDVVVLDLRMPDGSGVDVCRELLAGDDPPSVLMLTSFSDEEEVIAAVMAGASGYLLKDTAGNELLETVRQVASGRSVLDPEVTARVLERMRTGTLVDPTIDRLRETERRILRLLSEGLTNRQLASRTGLSEKTVKNYVSDILAKLDLSSRTQAAVFAVEHADELRERTDGARRG